jgi:Protein of unknown function (DUF3298).
MRVNEKMKSAVLTVLIIALIAIMSSCGEAKELTYEMKSLSQTVIAPDDTVLMNITVYYPEITDGVSKSVMEKLNMEFYSIAKTEYDRISVEYVKPILEEYADMGMIMYGPYEFSMNFNVTYGKNSIVSLLYDYYVYLGGAHPSTYQHSKTYSIKTGDLLQPQDIMGGTYDEIITQVKQLFIDDVKNYPDDYFDESLEMINSADEVIEYYLNVTGLTFYVNPYEIAPYSSGIRSVTIPFEVN